MRTAVTSNYFHIVIVSYSKKEKTTKNKKQLSKYLATMGRKNFLLTGRNIRKNWAQGGSAICCDCLGLRGGKQDKRHSLEIPATIRFYFLKCYFVFL